MNMGSLQLPTYASSDTKELDEVSGKFTSYFFR